MDPFFRLPILQREPRPRSLRGLAAIFLQKRLDKVWDPMILGWMHPDSLVVCCQEQRLSDWQQSSLTQAETSYNNKDQWHCVTILRYSLRI